PGRFDAADELDDHVDRRILDDREGVVGETVGAELHWSLLGCVAHRDLRHLEAHPGLVGDGVALFVDELDESAPDVAAAEQSHLHYGRVHEHEGSRRILRSWLFAWCSPRTITSCARASGS